MGVATDVGTDVSGESLEQHNKNDVGMAETFHYFGEIIDGGLVNGRIIDD